MRHVCVNGMSLTYMESGAGEPLILMHGGNSDARQYDVFRPLLGGGIRAVAYDQRDSPNSPVSSDAPYTINDHAGDAAALITILGLKNAHVMGVSYGGLVAMSLAINHPSVVKSLILGATAASGSLFSAPDLASLREQGAEVLDRYMMSMVVSSDAYDDDPQLIAECRAGLVTRDPESFARRIGAARAFDVRGELSRIKVPTLVMHGDEDPMVDIGVGRSLAEAIPGARFVALAGSRHGITLQHRQRTADIVREFVLGENGHG